jgi:hypothetical protein
MIGLQRGDKQYTARYLLWDDAVTFKADLLRSRLV